VHSTNLSQQKYPAEILDNYGAKIAIELLSVDTKLVSLSDHFINSRKIVRFVGGQTTMIKL